MTTMTNTNYQLLLPDEITTEIFSRLPAESLMQCKLVCKTWGALIVDPNFIYMYTHHYSLKNTTTASAAEELEWLSFPSNVVSRLQCVKYSGRDDHNKINPIIKLTKPIIYYPHLLLRIKRRSSCNGLVFMTTSANQMFVYNPFTKEYVDLPPIRVNNLGSWMNMTSGFGYHSSTNEYKVVMIYYCNKSSYLKGHVAIYTLGSGEWRDKGKISHRVIDGPRNAGGVLFNGALHWLTEKTDEIVSFDLADEEFRIVPSPISQADDYVPQLGLLGGCLYVTKKRNEDRNEDPTQRSTDIWVMDSIEYSWSKKFNISWKSGLSNHTPLALLKSGRILLHRPCGYLFSYDPETESSIVVDKSFCKFTHVYTYTKTFVSLKALGETDARYM